MDLGEGQGESGGDGVAGKGEEGAEDRGGQGV